MHGTIKGDRHGISFWSFYVHLIVRILIQLDSYYKRQHNTDAIFKDFNKAYNAIPHNTLLKKLTALGTCMPTLHWIQMFLTDRLQ